MSYNIERKYLSCKNIYNKVWAEYNIQKKLNKNYNKN